MTPTIYAPLSPLSRLSPYSDWAGFFRERVKTMIGDIYIVEGPEEIGNTFGYSGHFVPEGRWAVVEVGEFVNGGVGPQSLDGVLYATKEDATAAMVAALERRAARGPMLEREAKRLLLEMGIGR